MSIAYAHILAVDPDETRIRTLTQAMKTQGWYAVTTCADSQTALSQLASAAFDAILIEVNLAANDNFDLLKRIRANPKLNQIPVIILATLDEYDLVTASLEQGAIDYICMPANETLLRTRLRTHLLQREVRAQALSSLNAFNDMKKLADDLRQVILPLGIALSAENDFDLLLERIVEEACAICHADAGTLYLRVGDALIAHVMRTESLGLAYGGAAGGPMPLKPLPLFDNAGQPNRHNVAALVALEGQPIHIPDIYRAEEFEFNEAKSFDQRHHYRTVSCLTVPLKINDVIGVLQLHNAKSPDGDRIVPFSIHHKLVTESLAAQAAVVMHNHVLRRRQESLLQAEQELLIGRQVQAGFLPQEIPQPPGWQIDFYFEPSRIVAGDFYDVFPLPLGKIGFMIADVCDKGVGAAIFMAQVRSLLRAFIQQHYFLEDHDLLTARWDAFAVPRDVTAFRLVDFAALINSVALTNVQVGSHHSDANMFVTVFLASLDPETGEFIYVNGGHLPPLLLHDTAVRRQLMPTGPAVGLMPHANYGIGSGTLHVGETLLAYTDGVTEARDADGALFGHEGLEAAVGKRPLSAPNLLHHIVDAVHTHIGLAGQYDDITMLAIQRRFML